jgi:hypothetical protein
MPRDGAIIPPILRNLDLGPYLITIKIEGWGDGTKADVAGSPASFRWA